MQSVAPLSPGILETYRKLDAKRLQLAAVRKEALRSRLRRLLLVAAALSIVTHVLLLLYRYQIDRTEVPPESISFRLALDASEEAPCKIACNEFVQGSLMDFDTVHDFGKDVDVLTIEIENVNVDALEKLEHEGVQVYPPTKTLRTIQNKGVQKLFYTDHDIPTAPFTRFAYTSEIKDSISNGGLSLPFVWKSAQFGYDGQGVKVVRKIEDLKDLPNVECIAEKMIDFKNELAVVVARNTKGEVKTYPVVEMEFHPEANQVEYVICPARIDDTVAKKAQEIALKVSEHMKHVGCYSILLDIIYDA